MLDKLRIQCPSCGIILDVRNSKHEAIKQIVCPNCKKQLAVNFEEELEPLAPPQPLEPLYYGEMRIDLQEGVNKLAFPDSDKVEIKVVRLKDGNSKCMVRPLGDTIPVKVNGQQLLFDEQVVLSKGDYLEIGKTCLRAGEPGSIVPLSQEESADSEKTEKPKPRPPKERNFIWLYAALAFVVLMGATIYLWPSEQGKVLPQNDDLLAQVSDTVANNPPKNVVDKPKDTVKHEVKPPVTPPKTSTMAIEDLSDYDLEQLANKGDVKAQFEFGRRKINRKDSVSVVIGINYLKKASRSGSSEAKDKLDELFRRLMNESARGNSTANNILKENQ